MIMAENEFEIVDLLRFWLKKYSKWPIYCDFFPFYNTILSLRYYVTSLLLRPCGRDNFNRAQIRFACY